MLKAIYGCIQASALWYALIRRTLEGGGYQVGETDRCVLRKLSKRNRIYLLFKARLEKAFGTIQFEEGGRLSYLGMQLELREEGTVVDMPFYAKQFVEGKSSRRHPHLVPGRHLKSTKGVHCWVMKKRNISTRWWPSYYLWQRELGLTY